MEHKKLKDLKVGDTVWYFPGRMIREQGAKLTTHTIARVEVEKDDDGDLIYKFWFDGQENHVGEEFSIDKYLYDYSVLTTSMGLYSTWDGGVKEMWDERIDVLVKGIRTALDEHIATQEQLINDLLEEKNRI